MCWLWLCGVCGVCKCVSMVSVSVWCVAYVVCDWVCVCVHVVCVEACTRVPSSWGANVPPGTQKGPVQMKSSETATSLASQEIPLRLYSTITC